MTIHDFLKTKPTLIELYKFGISYSCADAKEVVEYIDQHDYDILDVFHYNKYLIRYLTPKDYGQSINAIYRYFSKEQLLLNKKYIKPNDLLSIFTIENIKDATILELLDTHNIDYIWEYLHLADKEVVDKVIKYVEDNADRLFETSISKKNSKFKNCQQISSAVCDLSISQ